MSIFLNSNTKKTKIRIRVTIKIVILATTAKLIPNMVEDKLAVII